MAKKKQSWKIGDVFYIGTNDGAYCVAQIVGREAEVLNSVSIALFDERTDGKIGADALKLKNESVFSVLFTTRDLLDSGIWRVVGNRPVMIAKDMLPHESLRASGFIGADVQGSGIVNEFVNAYYGLTPWDDFHNPNYLDDLLISRDKKTHQASFQGKMTRLAYCAVRPPSPDLTASFTTSFRRVENRW